MGLDVIGGEGGGALRGGIRSAQGVSCSSMAETTIQHKFQVFSCCGHTLTTPTPFLTNELFAPNDTLSQNFLVDTKDNGINHRKKFS